MATAAGDDVLARTIAVIAAVCGKEATAETKFIEDLGLDSIDLAGLIADLEEEFGVVVGEEQMRRLVTVGDVAACFRSLGSGEAV